VGATVTSGTRRFHPGLIVIVLITAVGLIVLFAPTRTAVRCPPPGSGLAYACTIHAVHIWEAPWWTGQL
jgi:hypothetical protein